MSAEFFRKLAATSYFRIGTSLRGAGAGFVAAGACASAGNTAPFRIATHATAAPRMATATMLRIERNDCLTANLLTLDGTIDSTWQSLGHSAPPRQLPPTLFLAAGFSSSHPEC